MKPGLNRENLLKGPYIKKIINDIFVIMRIQISYVCKNKVRPIGRLKERIEAIKTFKKIGKWAP